MVRFLPILMLLIFLGGGQALAAEFVHDAHLGYIADEPCSTCHVADAAEIIPSLDLCKKCHDQEFISKVTLPGTRTHGPTWSLNHRSYAKGKQIDCSACHQQDFCLQCHKAGFSNEQGDYGNAMNNVHRSDFHVTHPIAARTDSKLCSSCHEAGFCKDCHNSFTRADLAITSHRRGWSDGTLDGFHVSFNEGQCQGCHTSGSVIPTGGWAPSHAREARKNLATCQVCHPEGDVCMQCHSARTGLMVNPHPKDWDDIKGRLERASDGRTCRKCH